MTYQEIYAKLKAIIADIKNIQVNDISADDSLEDDLGFTPAGKTGLKNKIEKAFDITIGNDEFLECVTLRDLAILIKKKCDEK